MNNNNNNKTKSPTIIEKHKKLKDNSIDVVTKENNKRQKSTIKKKNNATATSLNGIDESFLSKLIEDNDNTNKVISEELDHDEESAQKIQSIKDIDTIYEETQEIAVEKLSN